MMSTTRRLSPFPGAFSNVAWGALWIAFILSLLAWAFWTIVLVTVNMIFGGLTRGDYLGLLELFSLIPLAFCVAFISLRRRRFNLASTVVILGAVLSLAWQVSRPGDAVVVLDLLAVALVLAAGARRNAGVTTAFVVALAVVATIWLTADGKMTLYELTEIPHAPYGVEPGRRDSTFQMAKGSLHGRAPRAESPRHEIEGL